MNSNEEYLDSLLKSVEQKEESIKEAGIVSDLAELDMFPGPVNYSVEEELQDVFDAEISMDEEKTESVSEDELLIDEDLGADLSLADEDLSFLNTEDLSEAIYLEEHTGIPEELLLSNVEQEEEARVKPEIVVQSQDATVLDILKSNPDMLIFPEDLEDIFSNIGSNLESNNEEIEAFNDEAETDGFGTVEADDASNGLNADAGGSIYAENIQDMAEDDIMRLLQQSADVSGQPDNEGIDIDSLFDEMSNNGTLAQIQEMMDKAENNEPVSGEIDKLVQNGLTSGDGVDTSAPALAPKEIFSKIKVGFANIFKKEPEKKEKKKKERKSLFSKKGRKNKKDKNVTAEESVVSSNGVGDLADLLSWSGDDTPMADVPMWDFKEDVSSEMLDQPDMFNSSDAQKVSKTSNTSDIPKIPEVPMSEEDIELEEMRKMAKLMKMSEQQRLSEVLEQPKQSDMSMLWDFVDDVSAEAAEMPDIKELSDIQDMTADQELSDIQDMPVDQELLELQKMAELMRMSEQQKDSNVSEKPAQSDMSMLWDAIDNMKAEEAETDTSDTPLMSEDMDEGLPSLDELFAAAPEVQTNNANAGDITDLLSSLENDEAGIDFGGTDIDLFAGMEQEDYESEPLGQTGENVDENEADSTDIENINEIDSTNVEEKPKKRNPFKFNLFSRKKKATEEDISGQGDTLESDEAAVRNTTSDMNDAFGMDDAFGSNYLAEQGDSDAPEDIFGNKDIFGNEEIIYEKVAVKKEKKPGFFKRLFTLLTEEDEEIDALFGGSGKNAGVEELGSTSEENKEAMAQLDKEGPEDKKKNKGKKGKKDKKGEIKEGTGEENEDDEEPVEDNKKKKKPKKEKKEKKQKEPKFYDDSPKIPKRKIKATSMAAVTLLVAILAICIFIPEMFETISARKAYYNGDYETSYKAFYGKELSESDEIIFKQSQFMLALQRRVDSYYNFMAVNDEERAVEALIQEVVNQNQVMYEAEKHDLQAEAVESYNAVLQILSEQYGVSEDEAVTIGAYRQDALFTLHIRAIVAGEEFICPDYLLEYAQTAADNVAQEEVIVEETLEDILPEEEELIEEVFEEGTN